MIEAMACGTSVIAWRRGSVPEIIEHGVTGFIVDNEAEAIDAIARIPLSIDARCAPPSSGGSRPAAWRNVIGNVFGG
jgi:glycosyltransferase involved in cell wall biosynthesis